MNPTSWLRVNRTAIAAAVAVSFGALALPALAQNTTSGVNGVVTGPDGKPVAGATVTIVHVESGSSNTVTTDAAGRYAARGLRAGGPYTITVSQGGRTERREGVVLNLAETFSYDAVIGGSSQVITVTGRGVSDKFSSSNMGAGTSIGARELGALASIQRNLQDFARTDPRLAQTDKERGEISAGGQNTRFNSITIDGVTTNDTFGLEANNLPTLKQPISIDAIQSVQINLSNYDATQKGYTGANINAATKSGTNEFRGSVYHVYRDETLAGSRYNRTNQSYFPAANFKEATTGFTLGGPIVKDTLFFFASYEEFTSTRASPTFGPLGSTSTNVGITTTAINQAISTANSTWNMNVGVFDVPGGLEVIVKDTLLKLDWNISDSHRANLRYTKTEQEEPNIVGFSATGLSLSSWWYNQIKEVESVVGQWFADWSPNFSTELKLSQREYASQPFPVNGARLPAIGLRFSGALPAGTPGGVNSNNRFLNMGTELSRHFNVLSTDTTDAYFGGTLTLGAHEIKGGFDYAKNEVFNAFLQNVNGNYTFGCEGAATATGAVDYSFGRVGGTDANARVAATCTELTPAQRDAATLENFQLGRPSAYTLQAPLPGRTLNDAVATWSYANTGLFLQDTWKLAPSFNMMFGVRMDQQSVPTKPLANAAVAAPRVAGTFDPNSNALTRESGGFGIDNTATLDGNRLVQPRVGFNWDLGSRERRQQLRGGFGLFQGAAANVWLSNPFSNTGLAAATYSCTSYSDCLARGVTFNPNPGTQTFTGTIPAPNVDAISPNLEQPSVWKANLAFDSELPGNWPVVGGLVASAEWLHTKTNSGIYYQHLNLGAPTRTGYDGRQMFWTQQGYRGGTAAGNYTDGCFTGTGGTVTTGANCTGLRNRALSNPAFGNVFLAEETKKGGGDAITLGLSQPVTAGLGWGLAYTYTTAKEVSPLTSSTSNSNWNGRNIYNPNEEVLQNSNYLTKDRISANLTFSRAFVGSYRTTFGVFYEGRRGKPYSWTYLNDMNGDGIGGNDLMYIPSGPGSGEVVFRGRNATETPAQAEAAFWDVVNSNQGLSSARGGVVGRNNNFAPWVNNFDLRFSQEIPGFAKDHKGTIAFDILNFGNMLSRKWGRIDEIGFPSNRSFVNYAGTDDQGRYVYAVGSTEDYVTRQTTGESQWAIQVTLRYSF
jgi:Carboxypeptidase regulatory-like domain